MIRHGMFTIGVAVQAETFTNTPTQQNSTSTSSSTSTASKSAIFLAPSKAGAGPQSLRITFAYNKETNLPEVIINLNEGDEEQYLKLKPLKATKNIFGDNDNFPKNSIDISKALQVYCFEKMDSPSTTQVFEVQPLTVADNSLNPKKENPSDIKNKEDKKSPNSHSNSEKTLDFNVSKSQGTIKTEIEGEVSSTENIKTSIMSNKDPTVRNHNEALDKVSDEKKIPSLKSKSKDESSKSSSKGNGTGRITRRKSKSRVVIIDKGESICPGSPTKGINDKSKIPFINSAATGRLPCEYYRQKWLQENECCIDSATWNDYSTIQKTAGQKVINKMTAQQKKLEEDAVAQKKRTEFVFHEDLGGLDVTQHIIPIRRKQTRLQPLRTIPKCH